MLAQAHLVLSASPEVRQEFFFVKMIYVQLKKFKKNIEDLNITHEAIIYSQNVFKFLDNLVLQKKFDLAFLDPPYTNKTYVKIFEILKKKTL